MSIHRQIDDWFLGFTTRAVRAKESTLPLPKNRNKGLKTGFGLRNLVAAAKKHPEVMVKIPKRLSQNSKGMRGIRNHLDYVSRNGEIAVETDGGEILHGKKDVNRLIHHWQQHFGIQNESKYREALNIVLSMPAGTPPEAVKNAAREFAAEQFPNNQYAFALHHEAEREGEPPHPHVHLCVLMQNDMGERLNPRKNDLFEWRVRFAEKLRDEGVQCAATKRPQRGKTQKAENSIVRAVKQRGVQPKRITQRNRQVAQAFRNRSEPAHPYLDKAVRTRDTLADEYAQIARALYLEGYKTEAKLVGQLKKRLDTQDFTTQMQREYRQLRARIEAKRYADRPKETVYGSETVAKNRQHPESQPEMQPATRRKR